MSTYLSALLLVISLSSCSSSKNALSESDRIKAAYPPIQWITATGSATTPQDAQDQALANLARIFRSEIRSERISQTELIEYLSDRKREYSQEQSFTDKTQIQTNLLMLNARVLEEKRLNTGLYSAVAGINKLESAQIYDAEISNIHSELSSLQRTIEQQEDAFEILQLWWEMNQKVGILETLDAQNNLISGFNESSALTKEFIQYVEQKGRSLKQQMVFHFKGNIEDNIKDEIIRHYEQAGFNYDATNSSPMLILDCQFDQQLALTDRTDAVFYHWSINIRHTAPDSDRRYSTFIVQDRSGSTTSTNALARMNFDISRRLQEKLPDFIHKDLINN